MDLPLEEASSRADAHIAWYHRLLALVQAEHFFELAGARVEATEWLAWAHFIHWVLVGYAQCQNSMLLTLLIALPIRVVFDRHFDSPRFTVLSIHVPNRCSHDEPHRLRF